MFLQRCSLLSLLLWSCVATKNILATPELECFPVDPPARYSFYQCFRPNDSNLIITVDINQDSFIKVNCEGHFTCAEFPIVRSEDAGDATLLEIKGCFDISVECALAGVNVPASQIQNLRLTDVPLVLHGFIELNRIDFNDYGGEENEDWLPMQQLENMHNLKQLSISGGRTKLHAGQWANMSQLENLELFSTLNDCPPHLFKGNSHQFKAITIALNNFTTLTADHFKGLDNLKILNLYKNNIQSLPSNAFFHLKSLKSLDLSDNNMKEIDAGTFNNLTSLEKLRLSGNRNLRSLDKDLFIGLGALEELTMRSCGLSELPSELLKPLTSLTTLDLSFNKLRSLPPYFFKSKSKLVKLTLSNNELTEMKRESVAGAWNIKELFLDHNKLNFADITNVSPFHELMELEILNLNNNFVNKTFFDWRVSLLQIKELDLSYNNFTGFLEENEVLFSQHITVNLRNNKIEGVFAKTSPLHPGEDPRNSRILLDENPFMCDSRIQKLLTVLRDPARGGGTTYDVGRAVCASPPALAGTPLKEVITPQPNPTFTVESNK